MRNISQSRLQGKVYSGTLLVRCVSQVTAYGTPLGYRVGDKVGLV